MSVVEGYRLHAWGEDPRWESFEMRDPGRGEVLVEVEACGVGLTVLNCMNGDLDSSPELLPLVPGHEAVGRVAAVGEGVAEPAVGDRVMAYFYLSCFRCRACLSGREPRCERLAGWYGVHLNGGYAPRTVLPAGNAVPLPEAIPAPEATVIPDAVATPVHVCRTRLGLGPGDTVAVIGAGGGVGIHMVQVAAACGATVAGLERGDDKLALVERHGAIPVEAGGFSAGLEALGGAVDAVVDLVGTPESLGWGLEHLRTDGRLCVLTTFRGVSFNVDPRLLVVRESSIVGSRYASRAELMQAAAMVASGTVRPVVGAVAAPDEVVRLHRELRAGSLLGRGALVWSG
jgi:D-arabinose 1-dehydrogenase-like Zn-dependent alcohol dehydrogenase